LKKPLVFILLLLAGTFPSSGADFSSLPVISRLDSRNSIFKQYLQEVESSRRILFSSRQSLSADELAAFLTIYSYTPLEKEDLLSVAARCNIPYATLASLNRYSHIEDYAWDRLLLPSMPGIFVPETPTSDLERLLYSSRAETGVLLTIPGEGRAEKFLFLPGDDFSPTERIFFLNRDFSYPLKHFQVSSSYGRRVNPVTGNLGVHKGLDLAATEGSDVYTVKAGTVIDLGRDRLLGNYVIISHENHWVSLYGHLSEITTTLKAEVPSRGIIGKVGSTGQSTGPHLHFELLQHGQNRDPSRLLGLFKRDE
jgi:hypothetical protein